MKSSCCKVEMNISSDTEGTSFYFCDKCRNSCDPYVEPTKKPTENLQVIEPKWEIEFEKQFSNNDFITTYSWRLKDLIKDFIRSLLQAEKAKGYELGYERCLFMKKQIEGVKEIKLTQGKIALVSDCDYERINQYKWFVVKNNGHYYATRKIKIDGKWGHKFLHSFILGTPMGMLADHKDGNTLNCTRENLRPANSIQNGQNRRIGKNNTTGYKGVVFDKRTAGAKRFLAKINVNKKRICLGYYETPLDAAKVYDRAARKYFGEFACLNFPEDKGLEMAGLIRGGKK